MMSNTDESELREHDDVIQVMAMKGELHRTPTLPRA